MLDGKKKKINNMIIIGDTHSIKPIFELIDKHNITDSNLIHCGDINIGFLDIEKEIYNLKLLNQMLIDTNNKLYAIRGNHDYSLFWNKSMGLKLPRFHNLHLVEDHTIRNIEGKNIYFAGGAISIDRSSRILDAEPSYDYYEGFKLEESKINHILELCNKNLLNIDIVVTHSAPDFCYPNRFNNLVEQWHREEKLLLGKDRNLKLELQHERRQITELYNMLSKKHNIKHWFMGHFHFSNIEVINNTTFKLLDINEVWELPEF